MSFIPTDEMDIVQRPHKRTGVWSTETIKQKSSLDNIPKRYSRKGVAFMRDVGDEDETSTSTITQTRTSSKNNTNVARSNGKSELLKLPALSPWTDININLLLSQFNDEGEVKEDNSLWNRDLLFAEINNYINEDPQ